MYYILNQSEQIVAVDPQLLAQLNVSDADEFYKKFALEEITFQLLDDALTIVNGDEQYTFSVNASPLSGILGDLTLIDIDTASLVSSASTQPEEEDLISYFDEKSDIPEESKTETAAEEEVLSFDDAILFDLKDEEPQQEEPKEEAEETLEISMPSNETEEEDDLFELILPTDADNAIAEIETSDKPSEDTEEQNAPIYIDIVNISEKIGISTDDYNLFLNEYIDTAITLEEALQSNNEKEQDEALSKLSHLSNVLHLPFVNDLLEQIKKTSEEDRDNAIKSFFNTLGRLTTSRFEEEKPSLSITEEESTPAPSEEESAPVASREPIDLSNIKPIHFDFQLEEAAKDLSLPVELIEEFVNDFIVQAHEETDKMLAAYEKGDLETIQKIGHLLKGTSSNLRINPLSDTLYEIQFNEDIDRVPELVKNYWGHFLSLENQIKLISK